MPGKSQKSPLSILLLNQNSSLHNSFDANIVVDVYNSSYPVHSDSSVGNIDMLSTEEVFLSLKGEVYFSRQLIMKCLHKRGCLSTIICLA